VINPLDAEPLILARLSAQITGVKIASAASIAGTLDITAILPAMFLQPGAAAIVSGTGDGRGTLEEQTWYLIVAVAAIPDPETLSANYQAAGDLIGKAIEALAGWSPSPNFRPMRYAGRDDTEMSLGWVEFPIRFTVRRTITIGA
jgi:hypothetical protein